MKGMDDLPFWSSNTEASRAFDKRRTDANIEIHQIIGKAIERWPSMRIGQILETLDFVITENLGMGDLAWEREVIIEPWEVLARMKQSHGYQNLLGAEEEED